LLYMDGNLVGVTTGGTESLTAPNLLVLGAQQTLNNYFTGDIAEVQIYNTAIPDIDRIGLERALKCKYGLTGATTLATPTGLTGVAANRQISLDWLLSAGATGYDLWRSTDNGATYQPLATGLTTGSYVDTNAASGLTNYYQISATDGCGAGANSATVGVFLPLPVMGVSVNAGSLTLSWPGWASDWTLYGATNLTPPVVWLPVINAAITNNGMINVTLPIDLEIQFFRLVSP